MGIAVPSQLRKASHQLIMALIGYSGLGLAGYGWAGLGGLGAPLAIHRGGPFLCRNGEHLINGLCKKKRSAEAEPEAYYGYSGLGLAGYGWAGVGGLVAPLAIHRDGPFLCGNGEHLINGLCKKKRSAEADSEADAYYGYGGYGLGYGGYGYGGLGYGYGYGERSADSE